jgi:hypothetical protein
VSEKKSDKKKDKTDIKKVEKNEKSEVIPVVSSLTLEQREKAKEDREKAILASELKQQALREEVYT